MTLAEHCYPIVREFREAFRINQVNPVTHRQLWKEESHKFYIAENQADVADALGDMVFIHCGSMLDTGSPPANMAYTHFWRYIEELALMSGVNIKRAVEMIFDSNMSKLVSQHQMDSTLDKYRAIDVKMQFRSSVKKHLFVAVSSEDQTGLDGKFYPKYKVLKGTGFFEPKWNEDQTWILNQYPQN